MEGGGRHGGVVHDVFYVDGEANNEPNFDLQLFLKYPLVVLLTHL